MATPCQSAQVQQLRRIIEPEHGGSWPVLNLTGRPGSGRSAFARLLCDTLGFRLHKLDWERCPTFGQGRTTLLRRVEREVLLLQTAIYLDVTNADQPDAASTLDDLLTRLDGLVIVASRERLHTPRQALTVPITKPDTAGQVLLWRQALGSAAERLSDQIAAIVQHFDLGPRAIAAAAAEARTRAELRTGQRYMEVHDDDVWQACREHTAMRLDDLAQRIDSHFTWQDIVLPEDVMQQLHEIAAQVAQRPRVYEQWGFGQRLSRGRGISALFSGPSGTGKTMAAEVLANHLRLNLYRIDLAGVVSKYIGETERNLRRVFDAAEQSGAILFFDEADALFGTRTEVKDSHDRYANIEVDYLLQRMEAYRGLAILATNRKSALDRAFMRRIRFLVDYPFPDADSRRRIWRKVFPPEAPRNNLDYHALSRLEVSGGNIHNIALAAAFLAADHDAITMDHMLHAARREYAKCDKSITEAEFGPYYQRLR
jgi:SpoVK/Ycf46/Vps4 family AAA+-type ATPase